MVRRTWTANTLVVMPAAVAHSKPDERMDPDPEPSEPRWFCRAVIRVAIARGTAAKGERMALALLVAEHVWGDTRFAAAARDQCKG